MWQNHTTHSNQGPAKRNGDENAYIQMLLSLNDIPWHHKIAAAIFSWTLLAGYVVIPGTFASLQKSQTVQDHLQGPGPQHLILITIKNPPLLVIASVLFFTGASGLLWLGWTWRSYPVWLINKLIMPVLLHSLLGLITTLVNVYTARGGNWSVMAITTVTVTGFSAAMAMGLLIIYIFLSLGRAQSAWGLFMC